VVLEGRVRLSMEVKRLFLYLLISIASVPALLRGQMAPGAPEAIPT
jgi:hypothetical protein